MKTIYQTEIKMYFGQETITAYFTRRNNETCNFLPERRYALTVASLHRLQSVSALWVNKGKAKISMYGRLTCIEPLD